MKSFIIALVIFVLVAGLGLWSSLYTEKYVKELKAQLAQLPKTEEEFISGYDDTEIKVQRIREMWADSAEKISAVIGYDGFNRGDDAVSEMTASFYLADAQTFEFSVRKFYDALERIRKTDGINLHSIF